MAVQKYLEIDGVSYPVHLVEVKRKADSLDRTAIRTEDGVLHRQLIGVYMNYSVVIGIEEDIELYNRLFDVLSSPREYFMIKLPDEDYAQSRYIGSLQDALCRVTEDGTIYQDLSFNIICREPSRR